MIKLKLYPKQRQLLESSARFRGFVGGRGSGKSEAGAMDVIFKQSLSERGRGGLFMIGAPTYQGLHDFTIRSFKKVLSDAGLWEDSRFRSTYSNPAYHAPWAEFIFRSADNPDRFRGPNLRGGWLDEASQYHKDAWDNFIACVRDGEYLGDVVATFTPKGLTHWTYETFGQEKPGTFLVKATSRDNPFIPPAFYQDLVDQYGEHSRLARQELGGEFLDLEGAEWPAELFEGILFDDWPQDVFRCRAMACDPSKGKSDKSGDYSAFVWGGVDPELRLWVDADLDNTRPVEPLSGGRGSIVDDGIYIARDWKPDGVLIEVNGFQEWVARSMLRVAAERSLALPIYTVNSTAPKVQRIRSLGAYLAQRRLRIRNTRGGRMLLAQMRDFPVADHDDGPDALKMFELMADYLLRGKAAGNGVELLRG